MSRYVLLRAGLLILAIALIGVACRLLGWVSLNPINQSQLHVYTVYAYRQWQSTGYYLKPGDQFTIRATGQWMYSPEVGLHGPQGGKPAPAYYPLPGVPGGTLIGRIGDNGAPFYIGRRTSGRANGEGVLYLRINDDLLGDNEGSLQLAIEVTPAP